MGALKSKLSLIIIVAHKSCIVNKQIRVGDSKYGTFYDTFLPPVRNSPQIPKFYITNNVFFTRSHAQVEPSHWFLHWMAQTTCFLSGV